MKSILLFVMIFMSFSGNAQAPQFAVVRSNGTTYICPTWDSAYNKAVDGDNIYLPGTSVSNPTFSINKQLNIYGTGHYPDSTLATGKTVFNGSVNVLKKVHLEGFEIDGSITITNVSGNNSSFIKIKCGSIDLNGTSGHYINQCITSFIGSNNCKSIDNILISNSIINSVGNLTNSIIQNCIFLGNSSLGNSNYWTYLTSTNTTYKNNIFHGICYFDWYNSSVCFPLVGNNCYNNVFTTNNTIGDGGSGNFTGINFDSIFVRQNNGTLFDYHDNYHLRSTSPFLKAGDDGTQIGLYGGTSYTEGAVPSNPHIYFKQVDANTTSDGKLRVKFKVRTSN